MTIANAHSQLLKQQNHAPPFIIGVTEIIAVNITQHHAGRCRVNSVNRVTTNNTWHDSTFETVRINIQDMK